MRTIEGARPLQPVESLPVLERLSRAEKIPPAQQPIGGVLAIVQPEQLLVVIRKHLAHAVLEVCDRDRAGPLTKTLKLLRRIRFQPGDDPFPLALHATTSFLES